MPAAGERADHHAIGGVQLIDEGSRDMTQSPGHAMALHRGADRFGDHQTDPGPGVGGFVGP